MPLSLSDFWLKHSDGADVEDAKELTDEMKSKKVIENSFNPFWFCLKDIKTEIHFLFSKKKLGSAYLECYYKNDPFRQVTKGVPFGRYV